MNLKEHLNQASPDQLQHWKQELTAEYQAFQHQSLNLDLTRGKPSAEQLCLSDSLDGILSGTYATANGTDVRNYGGLDGIDEIKQLGAEILGVADNEVLAAGNSSLTLMYQAVMHAYLFGFSGPESAWKNKAEIKFLCPVPGYDRHFTICEQLDFEMLTVPMTPEGPDMDKVERLIQTDSSIKGMWCVPKYSNPTGVIYSNQVVERIARLGKVSSSNFRVFWDNAYAVHDLVDEPPQLANIMNYARAYGTENQIIQFTSTSKITYAGAGVAFMASSEKNLASFKEALAACTIGPDKVNQLRHAKLLPDMDVLRAHMKKHAALIKPRFDIVLTHLEQAFGSSTLGQWNTPMGGYFISFDTRPGLAKKIVRLAAEAGVKLTPAGATFPYGEDPQDKNIRIAPTVPSVAQLDTAMRVFVNCVKLASVQQEISRRD